MVRTECPTAKMVRLEFPQGESSLLISLLGYPDEILEKSCHSWSADPVGPIGQMLIEVYNKKDPEKEMIHSEGEKHNRST